MEAEEGGGKNAGPFGPRHAAQPEKEQQRIEDVEQQVRGVVAAGPESVELVVEHVRQPVEGLPGGHVGREQGVAQPHARNSLRYVRIVHDVARVVVADEVEAQRIPIDPRSGGR